MSSLTAIPLTTEQARALTSGQPLGGLTGHCVTVPMTEAFGIEPGEQAEFLALLVARAAGLLTGARIVVTAETDGQPVAPFDFGTVTVDGLRLKQVSGVFTDAEPAAAVPVVTAVEGEDLDSAWESPVVQSFLADNDLLWHARSELAGLLDPA